MLFIKESDGRRRPIRSGPLLKRAVSTDGRRLGAVTGAEIDELSFGVIALELSAGLWDDLARHRQRVTRYSVNPDNGEVVIESGEGGTRVSFRVPLKSREEIANDEGISG